MKFVDGADEPLRGLENGVFKPRKPSASLRGPKRAIRLCILGILLPALFISVPLYLRYRVYDPQLYPMAVTDMRTIDGKISTTWCQGNVIHSNTSFNAFLMRNKPKIAPTLKHVQMTRHLLLNDDMKEYWGFYLLKGSKVLVSSCSRQPGASLIIIKGHRHLQECAYIGDDSSEEEDELAEIEAEKELKSKGISEVEMLKKHRPEVTFEQKDQEKKESQFSKIQNQAHEDETDMKTAKEMREILRRINERKVHIRTKPVKGSDKKVPEVEEHKHHKTDDNMHRHRELELGQGRVGNVKFGDADDDHEETSAEVMRSILAKIKKLGKRGKKLLQILQNDVEEEELKTSTAEPVEDQLSTTPNPVTEEAILKVLRKRRDVILKTAMSVELNEDDEPENLGIEEGFVPDDHADHHQIVNETTKNDRSNSEIWSSFSSSEEALLNCPGLIMSNPLTASRTCERTRNDSQLREEFSPNTITFTVTSNGYYFFIFSSENEIEQNYVRATFNMKKVVYDVSDPVRQCNNQTGQCVLPLDFLSNEQVVIELPDDQVDEGRSSEEFILVSECQPRTSIYLICILAVPCLILAFAFQ